MGCILSLSCHTWPAETSAAFHSLQLSRRMRDYGQVLFTFVAGLKLVSGIIRWGGAPPPPPIASSNQNLSCNLTLSSPGQRLEFIQCSQQICIWLRDKLYILGWTEAWGSFDNEKTLKRDYDKTKSRVTRSWNSKRDLGFLPGFKIIGGVTWGLFLSRKGGEEGSEGTKRGEWLGILV